MALSLLFTTKLVAQKGPVNESQLKKQANANFEDENYAKAYLQYSQLLSLYPQDPNYNYRFGACMLFSQSDKKKPIDYIETAVKQTSVDNLAYFYLGRAYHLNYRFDDAIKAYQHFKQNASSSELKKHPVDRLIEMCNNGKQLLGNLHDLDVLRKKELDMSDYYQSYDLSSNGGTLLAEPDDFKTKTDKKKGLNSIIYLSPDRTQLFFASYGDDDKNGKDIYMAYRLPNGAWGKANNIGPVINTPYDEDYPFYDGPTRTLYFSSTGHNSMGGYDIFRSTYDEATKSWSAPVNMNFPINSPGDDILFIADTMNETAFFSSTRTAPDGRVGVYKIAIQPHAPDFLVVKGTTYNDGGTALAASRITVKNFQTNEVIGIFNTTADNGNYVMNLANGGHFIYTVETPNHKTQSEAVTLPMQEELTPFVQQICYEPNTDRLIIRNNNQGSVSDSNYLMAMELIQKNSSLDVNIDTTVQHKFKPATLNNPTTTPDTASHQTNNPVAVTNPTPTNVTPPDTTSTEPDSTDIAIDTTGKKGVSSNQIEQIAANDAKQKQADAQTEKEEANRDIEYATNKLIEAQQLTKLANQTAATADNITDPKQKSDTLARANQLKQQADDANKKAVEGFQLASQQQIEATVKQKEADHATQYATNLSSALKSADKEKEIKRLQAQRDSLEHQDEANPPTTPTAGDLIRMQAQNAKQDSVEVVKHNADLQKEADRLQQESDDYVTQAQKTDNANEKLALLAQARDLTNSKKEKENEIQDNQKSLVQLHDQYNNLLTEANQIDSATKSNPQSQQLSSTDVTNIKTDIRNYTPTNNNPVIAATDTSHHVQPVNAVVNNPTPINPIIKDTTHAAQTNPVVVNNPQPNPVQNNPDTNHAQASNPVVVNNPTSTKPTPADTTHNSQPVNPVVINTPQPNPAVTYSTPQASRTTNNAIQFSKEANDLSLLANSARTEAKQATDPEQAKALNRKADSLDDAAQEQRIVSSLFLDNADSAQYRANQLQLTAWQASVQNNNSDSVVKAQSLLLDAKGYHDQAVKERQEADNTTSPTQKQLHLDNARQAMETAITKQQQAHDIFLQANPSLNTVASASDTSHHATNPVVVNNPQPTVVQGNPDTTHAQPNNPVVVNNPQPNPVQTNPDTTHAQSNNPIAVNNPQPNPVQNNPTQVKDTTHAAQPNNPVVVNNPQPNSVHNNPTPIVKDTGNSSQPNNPVVASNPRPNPVQNNPNTTSPQPINGGVNNQTNPVAVNNPTPVNSTPVNTTNRDLTENKGLVNFPQQYKHNQIEDITEAQTSPYSETHPIPINPPLPEGLVYKVQIGAFKKPIPQAAFKGLQPIAGETTTKGFTRYTAGIFKELDKANNAKNRVHKIGYRDAFVVAFYNGKRISLKQAEALQNGGTLPADVTQPVAVNNGGNPTTNNTNTPQNNTTANRIQQNGGTANSIAVNDVKGLFFTVQVGAFKTEVTADKLYNLSPLFSKSGTNGNIRYNCGMYSDVAKATSAKESIVSKTRIKDAFVTAYYNGERISLAKAAELLGNKNASLPKSNDLDRTPSADNNNTPAPTPAVPTPAPPTPVADKSIFDTTAFPEGNIYAVVLADIHGDLTGDDETKVLSVAIQHGVSIHTSKTGRKIYTTGKCTSYKTADSLKATILATIPNAAVLEFVNNQPMEYSGGNGLPAPKTNKNSGNKGAVRAPENNTQPVNNPPPVQSTSAPVTNTSNEPSAADIKTGKVVFCVQVGAYSGQIPVNVANNLIKIANQGLTPHDEGNNVTAYTMGSYTNYPSAKLLKDEITQAGFPGCFVVAYHNGKKISLQEAQSLINK